MKVCGIIAEYDPFHNGHRFQLEQAREQSQADYMVCVLGCAFSQRGEAMMFDSHTRARMALLNGFDLVLGMPVSFSCAQTNRFAAGGVGILHKLGVISHISFGTESADLTALRMAAKALNHPTQDFVDTLKAGLNKGLSFAQAQGRALLTACPNIDEQLFSSPNFILGLGYLRELEKLNSPIEVLPIHRKQNYHSKELGEFASASAVRTLLKTGIPPVTTLPCPQESQDVIKEAAVHLPQALDKALLHSLLNLKAEDLKMVPEISEGLEERILRFARSAVSREDLIDRVKTRRYPRARISRALSQALLMMRQPSPSPEYARLLGFTKSAGPLLNAIAKQGFPLISRPAKAEQLEIIQDMRAEELWYLGSGQSAERAWKQEVVII